MQRLRISLDRLTLDLIRMHRHIVEEVFKSKVLAKQREHVPSLKYQSLCSCYLFFWGLNLYFMENKPHLWCFLFLLFYTLKVTDTAAH